MSAYLLWVGVACSAAAEAPVQRADASPPALVDAAVAKASGAAERSSDAAPSPRVVAAAIGSCPEGMILIPGGTFMMGLSKEHIDSMTAPLHKVTLTKPYCIDRLEVTLAQYQKCEAAKACAKSAPKRQIGGKGHCVVNWEKREQHPINCISWRDAHAYCKWAKKRLPSEAEWEFAARGPDSFLYPWGNQPPTEELAWNQMYTLKQPRCHDGGDNCLEQLVHVAFGTHAVGAFPKGASPFGVLDMGGNVAEWVQDFESKWDAPAPGDEVDPTGPRRGTHRVIKDLDWQTGKPTYNLAWRGGGWADRDQYDTVGVRCTASPR